MKPLWKILVIALGLSVMAAGPASSSQTAATEPTPGELLKEVRALRVAIERLATAGARAQVLLGRLQMQEVRVASIGRQVQEVRQRLDDMQREVLNMPIEITRLTDSLNSAEPAARPAIEQSIGNMKVHQKELQQRLRDLEGQEVSLSAVLLAEQTKWVEFSSRLDELDRALATAKD